MPRGADAAVHECHRVEALDELLARGNLGCGLRAVEINLVHRRDFGGKRANGISGHAADLLGPFRGFRRHIVPGAHDVIFPRGVFRGTFGHMIAVESDAVRIEKFLIVRSCVDPLVANGDDQRRIRAGQNGNPFVSNHL